MIRSNQGLSFDDKGAKERERERERASLGSRLAFSIILKSVVNNVKCKYFRPSQTITDSHNESYHGESKFYYPD